MVARRKSRWFLKFLFFLLCCIVAFATTFYISYDFFMKYGQEHVFTGEIKIPNEEQIEIVIPLGSSTNDIIALLEKEGFVKYPQLFKILSKLNGYDNKYKAGTHIISKELNYDGMMRILTDNPISKPTIDVRIPEGLAFVELVDYLEGKGVINKDKFISACNQFTSDYTFLKDISDREYKLEGYLYPDTYKFETDWTEKEMIERVLYEFDSVFTKEYYNRAKELGMTVDQVITLASLIEMEAKYPVDYKLISSVFHNRLKSNDTKKLQSDVTIQYSRVMLGLNRTQVVLYKDLEIDYPYNTYKIEGLPPGPITSPRKEAIEAALYPAETEYLYFFAKSDGTNIYNETYNGHINDQKKYGLLK